MGYTIAIAGKGGTGKTTVAGITVLHLIKSGRAPVLAVDADPNSCLGEVLGVAVPGTIGALREKARETSAENVRSGVSNREFIEYQVSHCLAESEGFDMIAMGRQEGPGCYCYANNVLRDVIGAMSGSYPYIVIDNEAGLENLSRRIVREVDLFAVVADPSRRGIDTMLRVFDLAAEMNIRYAKSACVVNRTGGRFNGEFFRAAMDRIGPDYSLELPEDDEIRGLAERGETFGLLGVSNPVYRGIAGLLESALKEKSNER